MRLKQELTAEHIFQINNKHGILTVAAELICFMSLFVLLLHTPSLTWKYWLLEFFAGLSIFRWLVILHECGHGNLFRQSYLNHLIGYAVSIVCLHPYEAWRQVHNQHHQWVGVVDRDPTVSALLKLKQSPKLKALFNWLWWAWLPIGFVKYVAEVFWLRPWQSTGFESACQLQRMRFSICLTGIPHIILSLMLGIVPYLTLFAPMLFVFCLWCESVQIPFHAGLSLFLSQQHPKPIPYAEQDAVTRNLSIPPLFRVLLGYNFYLHLEHHLFPTAPWYQLPIIQQRLRQLNDVDYVEVEFVSHTFKTRSQRAEVLLVDSLPSIES